MAEQKSNEQTKIQVSFVRALGEAGSFESEVSPDCTGQMAVDGLLAGDARRSFLKPTNPARPYDLCVMRTGVVISPNMTFREAGIIDGEIVEIRQAGQGAGLDLTEFANIVLASGITLTALKGLMQIAVKLIENEGKKSVTIKLPDREVTVQGSSADEMIKMAGEIVSKHDGDFQITVSDKLPVSLNNEPAP